MEFQEIDAEILEMLKKTTNAKVWEALKGTVSGIDEKVLRLLINEENKVTISVKLPKRGYSTYILCIGTTEYHFDTDYEGWSDKLDGFCASLMRKLEEKTNTEVRISYSTAEGFEASSEIRLSWKLN